MDGRYRAGLWGETTILIQSKATFRVPMLTPALGSGALILVLAALTERDAVTPSLRLGSSPEWAASLSVALRAKGGI